VDHIDMEVFFSDKPTKDERAEMMGHIVDCSECYRKWVKERTRRERSGIPLPGIVYQKAPKCPSVQMVKDAVVDEGKRGGIFQHIIETACIRCGYLLEYYMNEDRQGKAKITK